jgi:hypothetical protein
LCRARVLATDFVFVAAVSGQIELRILDEDDFHGSRKAVQRTDDDIDRQQNQEQLEPPRMVHVENIEDLEQAVIERAERPAVILRAFILRDERTDYRGGRQRHQKGYGKFYGSKKTPESTGFRRIAWNLLGIHYTSFPGVNLLIASFVSYKIAAPIATGKENRQQSSMKIRNMLMRPGDRISILP